MGERERERENKNKDKEKEIKEREILDVLSIFCFSRCRCNMGAKGLGRCIHTVLEEPPTYIDRRN
jgi:hypothetical protein